MFDHAGWMSGGWIFMLLVWGAPFVLLYFALKNISGSRPSPSARDLLDQAYARGEINRQEYLKKRDEISSR